MRVFVPIAVAALAVGGVLLGTIVSAASSPAVQSPADVTGMYCAGWAPTGRIACVQNEADYSVAKVAVIPSAQPGDAITPQTSVLMGTFYDNTNFDTSAGYIGWYDTASCTSSSSDTNSAWSDTTTWRSRISSFQGSSGCRIAVWLEANYTGASDGYAASRSALVGGLDNHVWSAKFT